MDDNRLFEDKMCMHPENNMLCTCIEDLSNEIFYEIFEYIDYDQLIQAFSNLKNRFETLLNYSFLRLKMNIIAESESKIEQFYRQFIKPNKHRIVSLYFASSSYSFTIDSSFNRLQSLVYNQIPHHKFLSILPFLTSLLHLSSLTVQFCNDIVNLTEIYHSVFQLSSLKQLEFSAKGYSLTMSLPINKSEKYSQIKYIIINHACKLDELIILLSYTPSLTHLTCMDICEPDQVIAEMIPLKMMNLISITIKMCNVQFHQFEIFIRYFCQQLRYFSMNTSYDACYWDANRWEQLISKYMQSLRVFKFTYDEYFYQNIELASYHEQLNQFTNSFWMKHGWFFRIIVDIDYWPPIKMSYCIYPENFGNRAGQMCCDNAGVNLTIDHLYFAASRETLVDKLFTYICTFQIIHLNVDCQKLSYPKLIQLIHKLSKLQSLRITSLSYFKLKDSLKQDVKFVQLWLEKNYITFLEIQSFMEENDLEKIQFFINLCSSMKSLQVRCKYIFNIPSILRHILSRNLNKFSSLCLWVPVTNDNMIKQLQEIIHQEKLLMDEYAIKRTSDRIYLQWKL
ncbi:hypothetical protein I4U23_002640 [Adineta vaga]|nr:hypothetical protein I4U23_002640 [Adineta vaga]